MFCNNEIQNRFQISLLRCKDLLGYDHNSECHGQEQISEHPVLF